MTSPFGATEINSTTARHHRDVIVQCNVKPTAPWHKILI